MDARGDRVKRREFTTRVTGSNRTAAGIICHKRFILVIFTSAHVCVPDSRERNDGDLHLACKLHRPRNPQDQGFTGTGGRLQRHGEKVRSDREGLFWTLGEYDVVAVVEAPDDTSITALGLSTGALGLNLRRRRKPHRLERASRPRVTIASLTSAKTAISTPLLPAYSCFNSPTLRCCQL